MTALDPLAARDFGKTKGLPGDSVREIRNSPAASEDQALRELSRAVANKTGAPPDVWANLWPLTQGKTAARSWPQYGGSARRNNCLGLFPAIPQPIPKQAPNLFLSVLNAIIPPALNKKP